MFFCNVPSTYIDFFLHGNLFQLSIPTKIHENPFSRRGNLEIVCMYFCHRLLPKEKVTDGGGWGGGGGVEESASNQNRAFGDL